MTGRTWARRVTAADPDRSLDRIISTTVELRFTVTQAAFAARVNELAAAAGMPAAEFAAKTGLDDLYLATACAAGDAQAWAECEAKHFAFVRAFARRFLPDADARDLADQVIADLWQRGKIGRYSGRSSLRTWLGSVVAHAAVNARRARSRLLPLEGRSPDAEAPAGVSSASRGPVDTPTERLLAGLVSRAIGGLPSEEKLLLRLYYEQGLTLDQMESLTRSSKATLSRRLKGIRSKLKEAVDALALQVTGAPGDRVREGLRLEQVNFDLSALLQPDDACGRTER